VANGDLAIDYGTSNTVALVRTSGTGDGRTRQLLFDGSPLLPSAVLADRDGSLRIGRDAVRSARLDPARYEPNPKRRIDESEILLGDRVYPLAHLIAATLHAVWSEATRIAGPPSRVLLTHPVAWGPTRRAVLTDACARAGMPAPTLVPEPVAAATYFAGLSHVRLADGQAVVVYDLGAGTFDVSVVRRGPQGFETLGYNGLDDVGGLDLDALVVSHATAGLAQSNPSVWQRLSQPRDADDRRSHRLLWDDAREAKESLSRQQSVTFPLPLTNTDALITRGEFEKMAHPMLARTVDVTVAAIRQSGLPANQLAGVFLVGGGSRIPLVATLLHQRQGIAPTALEQPEIVVAEGALSAGGAPGAGWSGGPASTSGTPYGATPVSGSPYGGANPVSGSPYGGGAPVSGSPYGGGPTGGVAPVSGGAANGGASGGGAPVSGGPSYLVPGGAAGTGRASGGAAASGGTAGSGRPSGGAARAGSGGTGGGSGGSGGGAAGSPAAGLPLWPTAPGAGPSGSSSSGARSSGAPVSRPSSGAPSIGAPSSGPPAFSPPTPFLQPPADPYRSPPADPFGPPPALSVPESTPLWPSEVESLGPPSAPQQPGHQSPQSRPGSSSRPGGSVHSSGSARPGSYPPPARPERQSVSHQPTPPRQQPVYRSSGTTVRSRSRARFRWSDPVWFVPGVIWIAVAFAVSWQRDAILLALTSIAVGVLGHAIDARTHRRLPWWAKAVIPLGLGLLIGYLLHLVGAAVLPLSMLFLLISIGVSWLLLRRPSAR